MTITLIKRLIIKKIVILSESAYDFKYRSIFSKIENIEVIHDTYFQLLKLMFSKNTYYHIRYIKYRGIFLTFFRLFIVWLVSSISNTKIVWTCHNIYEHKIPYRYLNKLLVNFLSLVSYRIIVFHDDLVTFFPNKIKNKIIVANFGDFKEHFDNLTEQNNSFTLKYNQWKQSNSIKKLDLIYISAAKKNGLNELVKNIKNTNLTTLIIAPEIEFELDCKNYKNIFFYNNFVKKEIAEILKNNDGAIGLIGHNNISVPTSIYMFASYKIPVIGLDYKPINSIINENKIGLILKNNDIINTVDKICSNYLFYQENLNRFLKINNWEKSTIKHKKLFLEK